VAYRPVAKQCLCEQLPFLGKGLGNTFLLLGSRFLIMQHLDYNNGRAVFSMWPVPRCCRQGTRPLHSSVQESVKRDLECVKLKNLHC
jgi:hypothetical protein